MTQPRITSLLEAVAGGLGTCLIAALLQALFRYAAVPLMPPATSGWPVSFWLCFAGLVTLRGYVLRRLFDRQPGGTQP
jgi:hypothetical protein